ncbi:thermonuclease family protein [Neobacillus niacini]|uniref:thermonuclease family protein n=1 Tax=Neobacillus niacini TaxID=86668 RepID=UPI002FFEA12C
MKLTRFGILFILLIGLLTACAIEDSTPKKDTETPTEQAKEQTPLQESAPEEEEETPGEPVKNENEYYSGIPRGKVLPATIVRVVDGDTLNIKVNGREETVRLLLVDTPETVHPDKPVQPFGPEASAFAKETLTPGKQVEIEIDVSERDKYGRLLCYLYADGKMFNELLLEKGLARVAYVYAPNTRYVDQFYNLQKQAQTNEIGIWSIENYATDQGFKDETAENPSTGSSSSGKCTIKGNISSRGDKIYHMPGQQYYDVTKPEEMFCSEEEAQNAGYRKSKR